MNKRTPQSMIHRHCEARYVRRGNPVVSTRTPELASRDCFAVARNDKVVEVLDE